MAGDTQKLTQELRKEMSLGKRYPLGVPPVELIGSAHHYIQEGSQ
jgi:hypothetical protein